MKNSKKYVLIFQKKNNSFLKMALILFLIGVSPLYAGTHEPNMRDLIEIISTDLSNSSFNNEEEMLISAKSIYYEKLAKQESLIKTVKLGYIFTNKNDKVVIALEVDKKNKEKGSPLFKELENQIKNKNPRNLNELLHQPYYLNNNISVEEWALLEKVKIIDFYFETLCKNLVNQPIEPRENTK